MKNKWKLVLPIVMTVLLLGLLVPTVALAQTTTAARDIANQTLAPGDTTQVTVTIDVAKAEALSLDENPPAGWTLTRVSESPAASTFKPSTNEWVWFQAPVGPITVVYNLTVPSGAATGSYTLAGTISGVDWSRDVSGESGITVSGAPPVVTTATRDIAGQTLAPGATTQVTVTIDVAEAEALSLDENPPAGWTLTRVSESPAASTFKPSTNEWVWFQAPVGTITVVYNLAVPAGAATGSYTLAGTISGVDWSKDVGGEAAITVSPAVATTATRDIANQTLAPGETTQVTVTIDVAEAEALSLDENPPAGWTLTRVSESPAASTFKPSTNEWVWFQAPVGPVTVAYNLTVPSGAATGSYTLAGTISGVDWIKDVGGETGITVSVFVAPSIITNDATGVTANSATLNGNLTSLGTATTVNVSFILGTTSGGPYPYETTPLAMTAVGPFSVNLSGLPSETTVYFKAKADGGVHGTTLGDEKSFTTMPGETYSPASVAIVRGTITGGSATSLRADDNNYLTIRSVATYQTQVADWYGRFVIGTGATPTGLEVVYVGKLSGELRGLPQFVSLYNWQTRTWEVRDLRVMAADTEDTVVWSTASPSPYISTTREIRVRVSAYNASGTFSCYGDLMKVVITR